MKTDFTKNLRRGALGFALFFVLYAAGFVDYLSDSIVKLITGVEVVAIKVPEDHTGQILVPSRAVKIGDDKDCAFFVTRGRGQAAETFSVKAACENPGDGWIEIMPPVHRNEGNGIPAEFELKSGDKVIIFPQK